MGMHTEHAAAIAGFIHLSMEFFSSLNMGIRRNIKHPRLFIIVRMPVVVPSAIGYVDSTASS